MNGLTLRVSSLKDNNEIWKNTDCKLDPINIELLNPTSSQKLLEFTTEFSSSQNVENQLKLLKTFNLTQLPGREEFIKFYCELYLSCPVKHPVRNTISKSIDREEEFVSLASVHLAKLISLQISEGADVESRTLNDLNCLIQSIGGCLESSEFGKIAFKNELHQIMNFFILMFNKELKLLNSPSHSPARKNELSNFVHNLLRITIMATQKFETDIKWEETAEVISDICRSIISNTDIPIDTKTNAGILIVLSRKNISKLETLLISDDDKDNIYDLCVSFGLICTVKKSQTVVNWLTETLTRIISCNILEPSIVLCICRVVLQFSKNLTDLIEDLSPESSKLCLTYALNNLDHYMDTVRHMAKDTLVNIILLNEEWVVKELFDYVHSPSFNKTNKGVIISSICQAKGVDLVRKNIPDICQFLIDSMEDNNSHNTNSTLSHCYEVLMYNELTNHKDHDAWFLEYVRPLVEKFKTISSEQFELSRAVESLILKAVKKLPKIVKNLQECQLPPALFLACLSVAKKTGSFDKTASSEESWNQILPFTDIKSAMVSAHDETRMAAFSLIVETHKKSEIMTKEELDCILYFFKTNINVQSPALRQQIKGQIRNLFIRLDTTLLQFKKLKNPDGCENITNYRKFLEDISTFCFDNFFQGSNFGRRTLTLKLLIHLCDLQQKHQTSFLIKIWDKARVDEILKCLDDTYENNKAEALTVLVNCPTELLNNEKINLNETLTLANSKKPADSLTAAYYLEYLTFLNISEKDLEKLKPENLPLHLRIFYWLFEELEKSFLIAEKSILKAASSCPMYGLLFCLRHIFNKVNLNDEDHQEFWKNYIEKLIVLCKNLCQVVGPIVNSSSPEGHIPLNDDTFESGGLPLITPQMILLCAWRTIKEVSLLLGEISFRAKLLVDGKGVLSIAQLLDIGSHFTTLLSETKHRGAFEQAYIGFSRLCLRLWSAQEKELHTLPLRWLKALIKIIAGDKELQESTLDMSVDKLCATRRSAGVPFLMQALITTELQIGTHKSLKFCMNNLIELCDKTRSTETRTHALNILRALFRCTDLGEAIAEYVSDGFICAIQSYDAETWGERNSATLLFSALMIRVFGVQRSRDSENLNVRNKMTGRIFFLRYPKLYDFFYNELQIAEKITVMGLKSLKLFSLLLLLNRLYPSALEGVESNLQLAKFIPLVSSCSGSPEIKTRQLAARIVPIFLTPDDIIKRIFKIIEILQGDMSNVALNFIHGALLQLFYMVKALPVEECATTNRWTLGEVSETSNKSSLENILQELTQLVPSLRKLPVIWNTFYDVLIEIFTKVSSIQNLVLNLDTFIKPMDHDIDDIGYNILHKKIVLLKFVKVVQNPSNETLENFIKNLGSSALDYEYQEAVLNILLLILDLKEISNEADDLEISESEVKIVERFLKENNDQMGQIQEQILTSDLLLKIVNSTLKRRFHYLCSVKTYALVGYSEKFTKHIFDFNNKNAIEAFTTKAESKKAQLRDAMYSCLQKYVNSIESLDDLRFLINIVGPENLEKLRFTACGILNSLLIKILNDNQKHTNVIYPYFWSVLTLLRDDNSAIRASASAVAMKIFNSFYSTNEPVDVIAFVACEKLFKLLHDFLYVTFADEIHKIPAVYVEILILDRLHLDGGGEEVDNSTSIAMKEDNMTKCFDKNEANVFAENFFIKVECFKRLLELEQKIQEENHLSELRLLIENLREDEELVKWISRH